MLVLPDENKPIAIRMAQLEAAMKYCFWYGLRLQLLRVTGRRLPD